LSSKDYIVRLYRSGDEEAILEVLKTCYAEWRDAESPIDHWKWKYLDTPHGSIFIVTIWNGKIVGVAGILLLNVKIDAITYSGYGDDSAIHPDYRRKGIYKDMLYFGEELIKKEKTALRFGIQIHEASELMAKRRGYDLFPFHISHMLKVRDIGLHFKKRPTKNNLASRIGFSTLRLLNQLMNMGKHKVIESRIKIEDVRMFDDRINRFWKNVKDDYNFIVEKNREYLNWRYCDPRSSNKGRYFVKQAVGDGKVLGFIVLEVRETDSYLEGYIMDLLALPGRMDVIRKLIEEANQFFRKLDINTVHYRVVHNHPYQAIFSEQGFIEVPSKLHLTYRMLFNKEKMGVIKDSKPSQIHFNYGDYY
jgi:GNAT superfamily N-acetyltransferase